MSLVSLAILIPSLVIQQQGVCAAAPPGAGVVTVRDSAGMRIVENRPPASPPPVATVVEPRALELGSDASPAQFARIFAATRLGNGNIVVADATPVEIRVYDASGKFVRRIGRAGQGPGEYERVSSILRLPGDTLLVADSPQRRLTYLAPGGDVIRVADYVFFPPRRTPGGGTVSVPVTPRAPTSSEFITRFNDRSFLVSTILSLTRGEVDRTKAVQQTRTLILHHVDSSAQRFDTVAKVATLPTYSREGAFLIEIPFATAGSFAATGSGFYQSAGDRNEIVQRNTAGKAVGVIRLCNAPAPVTTAEFNRWRDRYVATALPEYRATFAETARLIPYPRTKPAITQLAVDADGRIWARTFAHEGDPQVWNVFASTGEFRGTVRVPAGITVFEIGTDYMLAYVDSPFPVNVLRVYTLRN